MRQRFTLLSKTLLLLCALMAGSGSVWADETVTTVATFDSDVLVTNQSYASTYGGDDWSINMGGNNKSIGFNNKNCVSILDDLGTDANSSNYGIVVKSKNKLEDVSRITFVYTGGSGDGGKLYLAYSTDGTNWDAITLNSGEGLSAQGVTPSQNTTFTFEFTEIGEAYYGFILDKGNTTTAAYRFDNVVVKFLNVETADEATLTGIAVTGTPATFYVGDTFNTEGITVTATYDDASTKNVTNNASFTGYDMSQAGLQTVNVSYTEGEVTKTTTYEINVKTPPTLTSITLSGDYPTTFSQNDAFSHEGLVVTANYDDESTKDVTSDAEVSDPDMSTLGTKTITVSYGGKTATYTITVSKAPAASRYKLVTQQSEIAEGYNYLIVYTTHAFAGVSSSIGQQVEVTVSDDNIITNLTGAHAVQFEATGTEGNYYIKDGNNYLKGPDSNGLNTTTNITNTETNIGTQWTISPNGIANVSYTTRSLRYNTSSPRFCNYKSSNSVKDVVLYRQFESVTITAAEYATKCSEFNLDYSAAGITAYIATDNGSSVKLTEIEGGKVPANTPVVLYKAGANGTAIDVPVVASAAAITGITNDLNVVGEGGLTGVDGVYVLAKPTGKEVGFYLWDSSVTLQEGKVYLKASSSSRQFLGFESEAQGIGETVNSESSNGICFDLQGRRVAQPAKGLYIVNGRKVIVK